MKRTLIAALTLLVTACSAEDHFKPVPLFDGKKLAPWKVLETFAGPGEVTVEKGSIVIGMGESLTGVVYSKTKPYPHPLNNYEISVEARRTMGTDFFLGLTFPVRDLKTSATLILGGWGGGLVGISSLDGLDASENDTGNFMKFDDEKWYKIRLQVQEKRIVVYVDNNKIIDAVTVGRKIGMRFGDIEYTAPLGLCSYATKGEVKNLTIRNLKDTELDLTDH